MDKDCGIYPVFVPIQSFRFPSGISFRMPHLIFFCPPPVFDLVGGRAGKPFFSQGHGNSVVGTSREAHDRAPDRPASPCGSTGGSPERILFPPMLFPRNALASGPQVCFFAEKATASVKVSKLILALDSFRNHRIRISIEFIIFARRIPLFILEFFGG